MDDDHADADRLSEHTPPESRRDGDTALASAPDGGTHDTPDADAHDTPATPGTAGGDDVYASTVEGKQYRGTWYLPLPYDDLEPSTDPETSPDTGEGGRFRLADLPRVPRVSHVVGPSAIMLGASLGSGETLFWPVLTAQYGWTVFWAFAVGVLTQFLINTELQRWTLATGESIFRAFDRVGAHWPWVFLIGGLISLGWPGWAAGAAQVATTALGWDGSVAVLGASLPAWKVVAAGLMVSIWLSYQASSVMYNAVEGFQIGLLFVAIGATLLLVAVTGSWVEFGGVPAAGSSIGTLPAGLDVAVFLGGLAFAGAGGYLNLSQSLWMREKGYGMGNYQGRVNNPFRGDDTEPIRENGFTFPPTLTNLRRWRGWWRVVQLEHLLTFVVGLLVVAPALMSVTVRYASGSTANAIEMWLAEILPILGPLGSVLVVVVLFVALFTTEYAIVESFVRNSADILYESHGREAGWDLQKLFWRLLTAFCLWGIVIILLFTSPFDRQEPFFFLVVGAAMSGMMMWPYTVLVLVMNTTRLPEHVQPGWGRIIGMWWATGLYGYFSVLLLGEWLTRVGLATFHVSPAVLGSGGGGYALWAGYVAVQAYAVSVSAGGKREAAGTVANAEEAVGRFS